MALDAAWLKQLYGAGLNFVGLNGLPIPDAVFTQQICTSTSWVSMELGIEILPGSIIGDKYDIARLSSPTYFQQRLRKRLIRSVEGVRFRWGIGSPAQEIPLSWVNIRQNRLIELIPNQTPLTPNPNSSWPWTWGWGWWQNRMAAVFEVDYSYGFDDDTLPMPSLIQDAIGYRAMMLALIAVGYSLAPPGITSRSRSQDSLSQSWGTTQSGQSVLLGAQIKLYRDMLADVMATLKGQFGGAVKLQCI